MKRAKIREPKRAHADRSDGVEWAREMLAAGRARWNGGKPEGATPCVRIKGDRTVAEAVIEDRT
jgi:hypothetical protein